MKLIALFTGLVMTSIAAAQAPSQPEARAMICGGTLLEFSQGEDAVTLNGQKRVITWTDDGGDGIFDDGDIEGGHHLQIHADGRVQLDDRSCRDRASI